jgi:hypothetical protein
MAMRSSSARHSTLAHLLGVLVGKGEMDVWSPSGSLADSVLTYREIAESLIDVLAKSYESVTLLGANSLVTADFA